MRCPTGVQLGLYGTRLSALVTTTQDGVDPEREGVALGENAHIDYALLANDPINMGHRVVDCPRKSEALGSPKQTADLCASFHSPSWLGVAGTLSDLTDVLPASLFGEGDTAGGGTLGP